jgi:hypothetical protein
MADNGKGILIVAFDIGIYNMGMSAIRFEGNRGKLLKLDWRPLLEKEMTVNAVSIARAVSMYLANMMKFGGEVLMPDTVLIEQQFASFGGSNHHAIGTEHCMISVLLERFPHTDVILAGASARAGWQKLRASKLGIELSAEGGASWYKYLSELESVEHGRSQHCCDAMSMTIDKMKFAGFPELKASVEKWESENPFQENRTKGRGSRGRGFSTH